jgi:hypothetical protein
MAKVHVKKAKAKKHVTKTAHHARAKVKKAHTKHR